MGILITKKHFPHNYQTNKLYSDLMTKYNLEIRNFFQTGLMFFDTDIINFETKKKIIQICEEYQFQLQMNKGC